MFEAPKLSPSLTGSQGLAKIANADPLLKRAKEFETVFIAQMLNYAGMSSALSQNSGFGGDAFSSMLTEQYAAKVVENGGFGLAEHIYQQLLDREAHHESDTSA